MELMFKGEVLHKVPAGCTSKTRDPLTSTWKVGHILNLLKNMTARGLGDNMIVHLARLSGSMKDPELSKEFTELQSGPFTQRTIKRLDQSETTPLATSKRLHVGFYFAYLGNHEVMTWINLTEVLSRTRSAYLFLPTRIMGLISNRLYQLRGKGRFIVIYPRELGELGELWSPWLMKLSTLNLVRNRGSWYKETDLAESDLVPSNPTGTSVGLISWTSRPPLQ